jgi:NADPH2:quinone reductase
MKAWLMHDYSGIAGLRLGELSDPAPAPDEVVLKVSFAGLNPADKYLAEKQYPARPSLPHVLGRDGVGIVVKAGSAVRGVAVGERRLIIRSAVGGDRPGTFAEQVAVPVDCLAPVPEGWTDEQAGGSSLVYLTAWQALTMWGTLPERAVVLVTGASGGVGVACVQLGSSLGLRMVALSRSPEKQRCLLDLGAEFALDPLDSDWRKALKERLHPTRVHLAIDNIGGKLLPDVIDTLGHRGVVSLVGRLAGPVPQFNTATLFFRRLRMGGVAVGDCTAAEAAASWEALVRQLGTRRPVVDSVYPFEELPRAFERLTAGPMGKVLVKIE